MKSVLRLSHISRKVSERPVLRARAWRLAGTQQVVMSHFLAVYRAGGGKRPLASPSRQASHRKRACTHLRTCRAVKAPPPMAQRPRRSGLGGDVSDPARCGKLGKTRQKQNTGLSFEFQPASSFSPAREQPCAAPPARRLLVLAWLYLPPMAAPLPKMRWCGSANCFVFAAPPMRLTPTATQSWHGGAAADAALKLLDYHDDQSA